MRKICAPLHLAEEVRLQIIQRQAVIAAAVVGLIDVPAFATTELEMTTLQPKRTRKILFTMIGTLVSMLRSARRATRH
jgi:hypothetical protein